MSSREQFYNNILYREISMDFVVEMQLAFVCGDQ